MDAAMQLLEEVQHDFGEGPCLAAFAEDRVVAVEDLGRELVWDRLAVVVRQLQVRGVLSVPVRLADQPVGTLNVYATQPRAWTPAEVQALGAFAVVTAELVRTAVELANHQLEVAQLRQALASRVWIEQAKGMVAATEGVTLDEAFQQLRVRAAEARAREAEQDLQAAKTGLARRTAAQDRTQDDLAARERPPTSESSSPRNATGPLMTVTMSPTPVSGPRTCATGPPTNATGPPTSATATAPPTNATAPPTSATSPPPTPSSRGGQREQPAGTSSATPERFPRRRTDLRVTEQPSPPNHASSIHTMLGLTPAVARRLRSWPPGGRCRRRLQGDRSPLLEVVAGPLPYSRRVVDRFHRRRHRR